MTAVNVSEGVNELTDETGGSADAVMGAAIRPDRESRSTASRLDMVSRIVTVALLLCVALTLPVAADAGQCQSVVVFVQSVDDVVNFTNLNATARTIQVVAYRNNGQRLDSLAVPLKAFERRHMPAQDLITPIAPFGTGPNDLYLRISSWVNYPNSNALGLFSAAVTHGQVVREPGCVTGPASPFS